MLEMQSELGYAPVVELGSIMRMNEWITAAYAFSEFGNAYQLAELMKQSGDGSPAKVLRRFSDMMNLNFIAKIKDMASHLGAIDMESIHDPFAAMILPPILQDFVRSFSSQHSLSRFQYELANWQFEHCNYCASYLTLQEALITLVCEQNNKKKVTNKEFRDQMKVALITNDKTTKFKAIVATTFKDINKTRNSIAHLTNQEITGNLIDKLYNALCTVKDCF